MILDQDFSFVIQAMFLIPLYTTFLNTLEPGSIISSFSSEFTRQMAILEDGPLSSFSFKRQSEPVHSSPGRQDSTES